jgi:iron(III) transport system ATP-binding protein
MLRQEQLVATAVSDDGSAGIATVLASEFRGHDVLLTVDPGGDAAPIVVRQHSVDPPQVDGKVRLDVIGAAVVLAENPPPR